MSHALYQVSVKLQLMDGDKLLTLTTPDNYIDFPGGRIDESEQDLGIEQALVREVSEELGDDLRYKIADTAFVAYRPYVESGRTHHVMVVHYRATLIGGIIQLSDEHDHYEWVDPDSLIRQPERFASSDEHLRFSAYYA